MSVEAKELRTGEYDLEFDRWLEPLVDIASHMRNIKRYAPATAENIPFARKRAKLSEHLVQADALPYHDKHGALLENLAAVPSGVRCEGSEFG